VAILGVRGYYRDAMGAAGEKDRGMYDDAVLVVSPNAYAAFNANTDPSVSRRGIATLRIGVHRYRKGKHGISRKPPYAALRPATTGERTLVSRGRQTATTHGAALNIHRGAQQRRVPDAPARAVRRVHPPGVRRDGPRRVEGRALPADREPGLIANCSHNNDVRLVQRTGVEA